MANTNVQLPVEIWKDVVGFEGLYEVSNLGRVKSSAKINRAHEIVLKTPANYRTGYLFADLCKAGQKNKHSSVHRLVATAFLPNPEDKVQVNHINGDKTDNRLENLEWATRSENQKHSIDTGLRTAKGEKNSQASLNEDGVLAIRELVRIGTLTQVQIARAFGISSATICDIKAGRSWSHI